jgi:hypothetical protein
VGHGARQVGPPAPADHPTGHRGDDRHRHEVEEGGEQKGGHDGGPVARDRLEVDEQAVEHGEDGEGRPHPRAAHAPPDP